MGFFGFFRRWSPFARLEDAESRSLPTVKFDRSQVTQAVCDEVRWQVDLLPDIDPNDRDFVYRAVLEAVLRGGDLGYSTRLLTTIGIPFGRAGQISREIGRRASWLMRQARMLNARIEYAKWLYPNAPCTRSRSTAPDDVDAQQDRDHQAVNGKPFRIADGMLIRGRRVFPGCEPGCSCVAIPIIGLLMKKGSYPPRGVK
jgi:hypothetical protein